MNTMPNKSTDFTIEDLDTNQRTLKELIGEVLKVCKEVSTTQCSRLAKMLPKISVEHAIRSARDIR